MAEPVSGYLRNFKGVPIGAKQPMIVFTAQQPALGGSSFLITDPIVAIPDPVTGAWSTSLVASISTVPETVYDISATWLDEFVGMSSKDIIKGLRVPIGGGTITDLLAGSAGAGWVWIEENDAIDPVGSKPGDLVLNPNTGIITIVI